jgi:hypothetical protein
MSEGHVFIEDQNAYVFHTIRWGGEVQKSRNQEDLGVEVLALWPSKSPIVVNMPTYHNMSLDAGKTSVCKYGADLDALDSSELKQTDNTYHFQTDNAYHYCPELKVRLGGTDIEVAVNATAEMHFECVCPTLLTAAASVSVKLIVEGSEDGVKSYKALSNGEATITGSCSPGKPFSQTVPAKLFSATWIKVLVRNEGKSTLDGISVTTTLKTVA